MTKNLKGALVVLGVAAAAYTAFHFATHNTKYYARTIVKLGGASSYATLLTYDESFLQAWARGLQKGKETFLYNGSEYYTAGGKRKTL